MLNHTEPLAFAAGQLYTTLSVADAAAATAFIAGSEPRAVRQRYEQAITDAAVAVTRASSGLTDEPLVELLGRINAQLAVYTGLIETARTNNRMGNPVGSSYLSEASALMQQSILPEAQRLYEQTSARVDAETTASTRIPAPVIVVVVTTLAVRRVRPPLAGPAHPAPDQRRADRRRAGHPGHDHLGGYGADDLHRR